MNATPKRYKTDLEICGATLSKRKQRNAIYRFIGDVANPGDILFVTTPRPIPTTCFDRLRWYLNFASQGYPKGDYREWGTMVFSHMEKESNGGNWVPIVYQSKEPELARFRMPPGYFRGNSRLEILNFTGIDQSSRAKILTYLDDRLGQTHDHSELCQNRITFQTGLPNFFIRHSTVNCVRTTMEAYASTGLLFSHRCQYAPWWNYARHLGYPLFHSSAGVSPQFNYLQDHHLYSDPQMELTGAVFQRGENFIAATSPKKFSWVESSADTVAIGSAQPSRRLGLRTFSSGTLSK